MRQLNGRFKKVNARQEISQQMVNEIMEKELAANDLSNPSN